MLLVPNYWVRLLCFAVQGLCQLKNSVCITWLFSLVHSNNKSQACSLLNAWDTLTLFVTCIYFQYVTREWFWLYLVLTSLGTISYLTMIFVLPEAPMWLLIQGREQEAIASFNTMAKWNFSVNRIPQSAHFAESVNC